MKGKIFKILLPLILLLTLVGILLAILSPAGYPNNPASHARVRASSYYMNIQQKMPFIEKYAYAHKTLNGASSAIDFSHTDSIDPDVLLFASTNGIIVVVDKKYEITLVVRPELTNETVTWKCDVIPKNVAPVWCVGGSNTIPSEFIPNHSSP